jgi:hypothetical protein
MHLLLFGVKSMRGYNLSDIYMVSVFLEELCHYFWCIRDEIKVKYKVYDVISRMYTGIKFEDIFNLDNIT